LRKKYAGAERFVCADAIEAGERSDRKVCHAGWKR
jgi:hypothetical protein